jgi:hypothetical protein
MHGGVEKGEENGKNAPPALPSAKPRRATGRPGWADGRWGGTESRSTNPCVHNHSEHHPVTNHKMGACTAFCQSRRKSPD